MRVHPVLVSVIVLSVLPALVFPGGEGEAARTGTTSISYWIRPGPAWQEYGEFIETEFARAYP